MARNSKPKPETLKPCSKCGGSFPLDKFPVARSRRDGRHPYCRPCKKIDDRQRSRGYALENEPEEHRPAMSGPPPLTPEQAEENPAIASMVWRRANSKLSREMIDTICAHLARGHTRRAAAGMAGVHYSTLERWLSDAVDMTEGLERDLWNGVSIAEGIAEHGLVEIVRAAQSRDVHQARWHLERRFPTDWARREALSLDVEQKPFDAEVVRELIEKRLAGLTREDDEAPPPPPADETATEEQTQEQPDAVQS